MASLKVTIRSLKVRPWGTQIQFLGSPKDVKTGLLTSLAKYESRMSSLELAHQCLMVWNTLIAFRKLDMSRYMQDTSCLLQKKWFVSLIPGPWCWRNHSPRPPSVVLQVRHQLAYLGLDGLDVLAVGKLHRLPFTFALWSTPLRYHTQWSSRCSPARSSCDFRSICRRGSGGLELYR